MDVITKVPVRRVSDGDYFPVATELIRGCRRRCLVSMFIVDHAVRTDPTARLDGLLMELAAAQWRGVEVKLLVGGSRSNRSILEAALLAVARASELGIEVRLAAATPDNNSHVKLVVADDTVLSGSHNWSQGIFGAQIQDSVRLDDEALAGSLALYFDEQWRSTPEGTLDVSV
jgi:phosphatidylserine/phosphatidylglycerophosphate/cardiolipin synthase-like enzyme